MLSTICWVHLEFTFTSLPNSGKKTQPQLSTTIPQLFKPPQPREDMEKSFTPAVPCAGLTFQHRERAGGCKRRRQGRTEPWFSCGQCGRWSTGSPTPLWEETRRPLGIWQRGAAADLTQFRLEILTSLSNPLLAPGKAVGWIATGVMWKHEFCVPAAEPCYMLPKSILPSRDYWCEWLKHLLMAHWKKFCSASGHCSLLDLRMWYFLSVLLFRCFTKLFIPCFLIGNRSSSGNLTIKSSLQCNFPRSF